MQQHCKQYEKEQKMEKIRVGVVGLGHRGRAMFKLAAKFDYVECAAACDILPRNRYERMWGGEILTIYYPWDKEWASEVADK